VEAKGEFCCCRGETREIASTVSNIVPISRNMHDIDHHRRIYCKDILWSGVWWFMHCKTHDYCGMVLGVYMCSSGAVSVAKLEFHCWDITHWSSHCCRVLYLHLDYLCSTGCPSWCQLWSYKGWKQCWKCL